MVDQDLEWENEQLVRVQKSAAEQGLESSEAHSMRLIREAADSVFPMLKFTMDLPQDHASGMVPMLDLQVWVQHNPAGLGDTAGSFSQHQGPLEGSASLPAGLGDSAEVTSPGPMGQQPAGSGEPAGPFSHQGPLEGSSSLPAGLGDPAVVISLGLTGQQPAGGGGPAGPFSHQGPLEGSSRTPCWAGRPSSGNKSGSNQSPTCWRWRTSRSSLASKVHGREAAHSLLGWATQQW